MTHDLAEYERGELEDVFSSMGVPRFHARQVFRWIHRQGVDDFGAMTTLSRTLQERLAATCQVGRPALETRQRSEDGTEKFLLRLSDDRRIEAVYIPDTPAETLCISTQVGCAMGCLFCLTGRMGLIRNLTAGEIVGQVRVLAHAIGLATGPFNIVLMGMGEPLHNYDATMQALRMLADEQGLGVHPRRVTLSTVGLVPAIERLALEPLMPNLAISLHATTDEQRAALVPVNRKHDLAALLDACRRFPQRRRGRITFEYVLLAGVNDTAEDAQRLARLLADIRAKVNVIPLNAAPGVPFERPSDEHVNAFARLLAERGLTVSVRRSRGRDIRAACGQLLVETDRTSSPGQALADRLAT